MHKMTHATGGSTTEWKRYDFPADPGEELPGGALILDEFVLIEGGRVGETSTMRESVVLCLIPGARRDAFVTWRRGVSIVKSATGGHHIADDCMWGNYYNNVTQAVASFNKRVKETRRQIHDGSTARV